MEIRFLRQAHKFIKKAELPLKNKVRKELQKIQKNPGLGELLKGKQLKNVRSHHFINHKVNYRIAYTVIDGILIICIATRENFYRDLQT